MDVVAATAELTVQVPQVQQVVRPSQDVRRIGRIGQRSEPLKPLFDPAADQRMAIVKPERKWAASDQDALEQASQIGHAGEARWRLQERVAGKVVGGDL